MTRAEQLAAFVVRAVYDDLSEAARQQLKVRVLDALGCAIGALAGEPVRLVRMQVDDFGGAGVCSLIGGGRTAPDRAAFYNGTLVRYLDFNDSYLAKGETCHPSDNVGAVLAGAEYANRSGREFLTALAVAYQVQCRLSDVAPPVRAKGFDHTTQGSYAIAAGVSKALGLDQVRTANALAISGLEAGAYMIMIESEGITENVKVWRTDVPAKIANALGLEQVMFEAADPDVFAWYIKNYGAEVNLFVDHSQIVQLECLRSGIWGTKSLWGRVITYKG